ncbi:MAG: hypothetical protein A2798_03990 [Candidatus Levybacteria bacterium RIFCSPHIGHO2_01_FULL_37_17]|nr:MAG: hypothetical protein A2798_03990 [Candidatus Levybacteria bacterium RIFCSPHIGHO2_01_FULL_37_17]OGH36539.1 MAG: hypothetical protein A2959_03545 [Candidatus Levybacteria bacterium RIFCSPLOWO2_01_FULL_38_23]
MKVPKLIKFLLLLLSFYFYLFPFLSAAQETKNIEVTVSVPPDESDIHVDIENNITTETVKDNTEITYTITYGSTVSFPIQATLTADWSQGTIQGESNPTLDIVDYVVGSATNGIGSTSPAVDLQNNKISWTFNSFPANSTGNIVTFKLKTNSSYKQNKKVNFTTSATLAISGANKMSSVSLDYLYPQVQTSQTSTPTPTPISAPNQSPSPTPTSTTLKLELYSVEIRSISEKRANIYVALSKPAQVTLFYGTSSNIGKSKSSSQFSLSHNLQLEDLIPNTEYFVRILAESQDKQTLTSELFTFKTAKSSSLVQIDRSSIIVVSGNNVIFDTVGRNPSLPLRNLIILPKATSFQFKFAVAQGQEQITGIKLVLRKLTGKTVLGESSLNFANYANAASISMFEIEPGVFSVSLSSDLEEGVYQLISSYTDKNGNLSEETLALLKISNPFTVLNAEKKPVEAARVFLYIYNQAEKKFVPISSSFLNIDNPLFTNSDGEILISLPFGKYKADILNLGYLGKTVEFEISENENSGYPVVILDSVPITIVSLIRYYWGSFNEVFLNNTYNYFASLQNSIRFFDLVSAFIMLSLVGLTFYAFLRKNNIQHFPSYLVYLFHHFSKKTDEKYIKGLVRDKSGGAISGVHIYLIDDPNQEVINTTTTNANGEFFFKKGNSRYYLIAMKKGYFSSSQTEAKEKGFNIYEMEKRTSGEKAILDYLRNIAGGVFALSFEALLITSFLFLLIFLNYFGIEKTAPYLIISAFNIAIWVMHLRHTRHHPTRII